MSRKLKSSAGSFTIAEMSDLAGTAIKQTKLTAESDLDDIKTPGCYYFITDDNIKNLPSSRHYGTLIVLNMTSNMYKQIVMGFDGIIYHRNCSNTSGWSVWYKIAETELA